MVVFGALFHIVVLCLTGGQYKENFSLLIWGSDLKLLHQSPLDVLLMVIFYYFYSFQTHPLVQI